MHWDEVFNSKFYFDLANLTILSHYGLRFIVLKFDLPNYNSEYGKFGAKKIRENEPCIIFVSSSWRLICMWLLTRAHLLFGVSNFDDFLNKKHSSRVLLHNFISFIWILIKLYRLSASWQWYQTLTVVIFGIDSCWCQSFISFAHRNPHQNVNVRCFLKTSSLAYSRNFTLTSIIFNYPRAFMWICVYFAGLLKFHPPFRNSVNLSNCSFCRRMMYTNYAADLVTELLVCAFFLIWLRNVRRRISAFLWISQILRSFPICIPAIFPLDAKNAITSLQVAGRYSDYLIS